MDGIPQGGLGAGKGTGKKKVCFVITNRVHYTRCKQLIQQLKNHPQLELQLVVAASALLPKYGDVTSELERDGVPIHAKINMLLEGGSPITMAKTTGLGLLEMSTVLENLKPDVVLVRGDRYEVLAIAIAAAYMNIPLAHIEGGDVTGTIDESVRHAITKLAHLHFPTNELSKERIIKMGEDPKQVHNVGSLDIEYLTTIDLSFPHDLWEKGPEGLGERFDLTKGYVVVMQHPVTTEYGSGRQQMEETIQAIDALKMPTIWIWPNIDAGNDEVTKAIRVYREHKKPPFVHFYRYISPELFARVLNHASCLVGNSSAGIKECSYLGTPVVDIGTRQGGRTRAENVMSAPHNQEKIKEAMLKQIKNRKYPSSAFYLKEKTSHKIAEILAETEIDIQKQLMY